MPTTLPFPLLELCRHPRCPPSPVARIEAGARRTAAGGIELLYRLRGDIARLRLALPDMPAAEPLWQHTCFEIFLAAADETAYREYNFSPNGAWTGYRFDDYRQPADAIDPTLAPPVIESQISVDRIELGVTLDAAACPPRASAWQVGLSVVVECADTIDDGLGYWALAHCAAQPDFHRRESFRLALPVPTFR